MQNYVPNALHEFQHPYPKKPQHSPHKWECPNYGTKTQCTKEENSPDILHEQRIKLIQKLVGGVLYYIQSVNPTLIEALG